MELAILLEASCNKPGNVNRTTNYEDTRYEHFLASAVASAPSFKSAAQKGVEISLGEIEAGEISLGRIIKDCVLNIRAWHHGGNTLLGTVILLSPIAVAAGAVRTRKGNYNISDLRRWIKNIVESTTPQDAVDLYTAISITEPGGLGSVPELDVEDPNSIARILDEGITLYDTFKIASDYDSICSEWTSNYTITFDIAFPNIEREISEKGDLNSAIIYTFLKVLSEHPDTLIARKAGKVRSNEVSSMAKDVLSSGGFETLDGKKRLRKFDLKLRKFGSLMNPGTTADIISAALSVTILNGYRP
ncbi:MAG: triphosphoribosyl-dephospho-CoA synthase [Candidatus Bathyarchaeota archaeon]